jgi:glycosyltransferase involved in cell wall biosynthesis
MNVLFLSSWYPTKKNPNFGIFVKEHAHAIHVSGNNIVVLAIVTAKSNKIFDVSTSDFKDELGVRTIIVEINSLFKNYINYLIPLQYIYLKKTTEFTMQSGFKPQIIHSNVIFPMGIMGSWLSKKLNIPHIITEHWSRIQGFITIPFFSYWGKNAYLNAEKILPVSRFLQNRIKTIIPELSICKFKVVGNVVDSGTFFYSEKTEYPEPINFCAVATWATKKIPDKLPELFIEALSTFQKKTNRTITLTMIGGGDKIPELKEICKKENLETYFTDYISKQDIAEHLHKADYFIHASKVETFGVVIAEALLCGTPVICSNVGALPELINDSNGVLCENKVENWVNGLIEINNHNYNRKEISDQIKSKYNLESIGRQLTDIYLNIVS